MKFNPYSNSRMEHASCPWSFAQNYIRRMTAKPDVKFDLVEEQTGNRINLLFGSTVHSLFEQMTQKDNFGLPEFMPQVPKEILETNNEMYNIVQISKCAELFKNNKANINELYGIEEKMAVDISGNPCSYDGPRAFVRGKYDELRLDLTQKWAKIRDYKTQPNIVEAADSLQLKLYAWILWRNFPELETIETELYFARYGCSRSAVFYRDEIDWVEAYVRSRTDMIENIKDFTVAQRCNHCGICDYANVCPLIPQEKAMGDIVPVDIDEARRLYGKLIGLDKDYKKTQDNIKLFVQNSGPVDLSGGQTIGYKYYPNEQIDVKVLLDWYKEGKVRAGSIFSIDKKAFDKLCYALEQSDKDVDLSLAAELRALVKEKGQTRFCEYKEAIK